MKVICASDPSCQGHGHLPETRTSAETDHRSIISLHMSMVVTMTLKEITKTDLVIISSCPLIISQLFSIFFHLTLAILHEILHEEP